MNALYSIYALETGNLTGAYVMSTNPDDLARAIPEGCGIVLGDWDYRTNRVDPATGTVIGIDPTAPDWRDRQASAASAAYAEIVSAEAQQARPMREIVDALINGVTPPEAALDRFDALKAQIDSARSRYQAILAAQTAVDLLQVEE